MEEIMSKSINKVHLIGHVGFVRERETSHGRVVNFSLATNLQWKDKKGHPQERVEWHRCACWLKDAPDLFVGDQLYVEGRLTYSDFDPPGVELEYPIKLAQIKVSKLIPLLHPDVEEAYKNLRKMERRPKRKGKPKFIPPQEEIEF